MSERKMRLEQRDSTGEDRATLLRRVRQLEWLTVGWNVVEGIAAVTLAMLAGSVALLGFGLDSFVETMSGLIILWRVAAEGRADNQAKVKRIDRLARRGVSISLWLLVVFVVNDAMTALVNEEQPSSSPAGILLLVASVAVMWWLAREKRSAGRRLHSHAIEADAAQTDICWKLSIVALTGLLLNAVLGWWWADPAAALGLAFLIGREAGGAWKGRPCCA